MLPRADRLSLVCLAAFAGVALCLSAFVPQVARKQGAHRTSDQLIATPTSVQWRHPIGSFPSAQVITAPDGSVASVVPAISGLPVVSLVTNEDGLFDPERGIYVVGNAFFHTKEEAVQRYPDDQKWWKYPGNFLFRGKKWAREASMEYFDHEGKRVFTAPVELRINGNNTRGFPQHALRVTFEDRTGYAFFGKDHGTGYKRILLRASGNDQDRTFFRDQFQHALCAGLPFGTASGDQCVVFINGAYWGLHNLRERLDENELARRYHVKPKKITIIADRLELYRGEEADRKRFSRLLTMSGKWEPAVLADSLNARMDLDGFLSYMAAQIILCNHDWPDQNGKWWRYNGAPDTTKPCLDGRWYWLMGDSDLSFGLATGPEYDMFKHVEMRSTPLARLFNNCMRASDLRSRFRSIALELLDGALSPERMRKEAEAQRSLIEAEMPRHIRRWRRPLTFAAWKAHVDELLDFAAKRGAIVRGQLDKHYPPAKPA